MKIYCHPRIGFEKQIYEIWFEEKKEKVVFLGDLYIDDCEKEPFIGRKGSFILPKEAQKNKLLSSFDSPNYFLEATYEIKNKDQLKLLLMSFLL